MWETPRSSLEPFFIMLSPPGRIRPRRQSFRRRTMTCQQPPIQLSPALGNIETGRKNAQPRRVMSVLLWRSILSGYPRTTRLTNMIWGRHSYLRISLWDYHPYGTGPVMLESLLGSWIWRGIPNWPIRFQWTPPEPAPWTRGRKRKRRNIIVPRSQINQSSK